MEQLLARLSSLSYELLGIILPGLIALILLVLWLVGIGDLLPYVSNGFFPRVTLSSAAKTLEGLGVRTGFGIAGPLLLATYFFGHLLHWIGRTGKGDQDVQKKWMRRTGRALLFRIPKPASSYNAGLEPLYQAVLSKFGTAGQPLTWTQFYPVAKSFLARNLSPSLVTLYQNKYTLHRSLTAAAALIFWMSMAALICGLFTVHLSSIAPRWTSLGVLSAGCLALVWGFSGSFAYNWELFGNTIITETYSLLNGPEVPGTKNAKSP